MTHCRNESASPPALEAVEERFDVWWTLVDPPTSSPTWLRFRSAADSSRLRNSSAQSGGVRERRASGMRQDVMFNQWLARMSLSCHPISVKECAKLVTLISNGTMAELWPSAADFICGLFGRWKFYGEMQRLLVDARPPTCHVWQPTVRAHWRRQYRAHAGSAWL